MTLPKIELRGFCKDWTLEIAKRGTGGNLDGQYVPHPWSVRIVFDVADTDTGTLMRLQHVFMFPQEPTIEEVHDCLRRVAVHEIDEALHVEGRIYKNPHNAPDSHHPRPPWMCDLLRWQADALLLPLPLFLERKRP